MGYELVNSSSQYFKYGALSCIRIDEERDLTDGLVDEIVGVARKEGATFDDDGDEEVFVVEFPGRPQEVYTESALRRSLKPYLLQSD